MTHALPCAERLLGRPASLKETADQLKNAARVLEPLILAEREARNVVRFVDGRGHARAIYGLLMLHLFAEAIDRAGRPEDEDCGHETLVLSVSIDLRRSKSNEDPDPLLALWGLLPGRPTVEAVRSAIEVYGNPFTEPTGRPEPLFPQDLDASPDEWTYRELVGLHALHAIAERTRHDPWRERVREITAYHQHHTQPDYTTYQPWAVAAFLSNPETVGFAEQQLHDVETHLHIEAGPGAVLPALLLADAYASLTALKS